jgi:hypothetical protein
VILSLLDVQVPYKHRITCEMGLQVNKWLFPVFGTVAFLSWVIPIRLLHLQASTRPLLVVVSTWVERADDITEA